MDTKLLISWIVYGIALLLIVVVCAWAALRWPSKEATPEAESECACYEYLGDNLDCPIHAAQARYLRSDPIEQLMLRREMELRAKRMGGRAHSYSPSSTEQTEKYLRRGQRVN